MQRGEDLTVVEVDSQQILDERDALIEHRSRQVRRGRRSRAVARVREHRAQHVKEVAASVQVVLDERCEHPLAVLQRPVVVAQARDEAREGSVVAAPDLQRAAGHPTLARGPTATQPAPARRPRQIDGLAERREAALEVVRHRSDRDDEARGCARRQRQLPHESRDERVVDGEARRQGEQQADAVAPLRSGGRPSRRQRTTAECLRRGIHPADDRLGNRASSSGEHETDEARAIDGNAGCLDTRRRGAERAEAARQQVLEQRAAPDPGPLLADTIRKPPERERDRALFEHPDASRGVRRPGQRDEVSPARAARLHRDDEPAVGVIRGRGRHRGRTVRGTRARLPAGEKLALPRGRHTADDDFVCEILEDHRRPERRRKLVHDEVGG